MPPRPIISGQPPKFLVRLLSHSAGLALLLLCSASIYICLVFSNAIGEKTKIQENALLAGLVEEQWRDTAKLQEYLHGLGQIKRKEGPRSELRDYVANAFVSMGLEVGRHRFRTVPSSFSRPNSSFGSGENVFAIVRSFRAAPVEAILLVIPMRASHLESMAIALSLANHAKNQLYWARDLVFLFADGGSKLGVEAWLSHYHGQKHPFFEAPEEELAIHGGTFIGALGIDVSGTLADRVEVQYQMVNGKLPNMDLLNLFVMLVEKAGSVPSINGVVRARNEHDFLGAAQTFANGVLGQSLDEMDPLTAVSGRFGLHAVTLRSRQADSGHSTAVDLVEMARLVEGGMRSLNNLLEKLHHSYLLYSPIHPHRFISAALSMPLLGLLLAPLLLLVPLPSPSIPAPQALRDWLSLGATDHLHALGSSLRGLCYSHLLALAFYALQNALYASPHFLARTQVALFSLALPGLLLLLLLPLCPRAMSSADFHSARFLAAIESALFLGALGLVNFSLALLLSLLLLPLALASLCLPSRVPFLPRLLLLFLLNPISLALFLLPFRFCAGLSPMACWHKSTAKVAGIALAHFAHGSWLLAILSGPVLAICLCFGRLLLAKVAENGMDEGEENGGHREKEE